MISAARLLRAQLSFLMYQYERRRLHQAVALIYGLIGVGLLSYLTLMLNGICHLWWKIK